MKIFLKKSFRYIRNHSILLVFALYIGYLGFTFICPEFFTDPIMQDDYALHYANSSEVVNHLKCRGVPWGYSPQYCGGRLSFGIDDIWSSFFLLLFAPLIGNVIAFNFSIIAGFAVPPLSILFLLKSFKCDRMSVLTGTTLSMLAINGMIPIRSFYYTGCYGFVIGTALCFLLLGVLNSWIRKNKKSSLILITAIGTLCIAIHPLSALIFLILLVPFIIVNLKFLKIQNLLQITIAGLIATGLNLTWLIPYFHYSKNNEHIAITGMQTHSSYIFDVLLGNKAFLVLSLLYVSSLWIFCKKKLWREYSIWGVPSVGFFIIGFFGSQIGLGEIEPNRFIIPLIFLMIVAISSMPTDIVSRKNIPGSLLLVCFIILLIKPMPTYIFGLDRYPAAAEIINVLKSKSEDSGRILLQDSYDHPYFDCHFSALLPLYTGRETTANTYRLTPPIYPQFVEDRLFGTSLSEITTDQLKKHLDLYNIRYILVYSSDVRNYFDSCSLVEPVKYIDIFSIYSVKESNESFCYDCTTKTVANNSGIFVENSSDSITILKYHYFKSMKVLPDSITIEPVFLMNDPTPFIRIRNQGVHQFKIVCK